MTAIIYYSLPMIRQKCKESHQDVMARIAALPPPPPENPVSELLRLVTGFASDVGALVKGIETFERLLQKCRPAYAKFKLDIRSTAPDFVPFTDSDDSSQYAPPIFEPGDEAGVMCGEIMNLDYVRKHIQRWVHLPSFQALQVAERISAVSPGSFLSTSPTLPRFLS